MSMTTDRVGESRRETRTEQLNDFESQKTNEWSNTQPPFSTPGTIFMHLTIVKASDSYVSTSGSSVGQSSGNSYCMSGSDFSVYRHVWQLQLVAEEILAGLPWSTHGWRPQLVATGSN